MVNHGLREARNDLRREGWLRFWFAWGGVGPGLRAAAYDLGRFTPSARRRMDRYAVLRVPSGVAWTGAVLAVALVPRWLPRAGALPRTPWVGAACLHPLPLIAGVEAALTPEVLAHEFAHLIWPALPRKLRRNFRRVLVELEAADPALTEFLDVCLEGYKDRRSPDECHVRLLERWRYGRRSLPESLRPYYGGWVEPA